MGGEDFLVKDNVRSILLLLKQFGFTDKTLKIIYQNEEAILEVIFNKNHPFHNKYFDIYTTKEKEISQDFNSLVKFTDEFTEKMKEYKRKGIKIYCSFIEGYPKHLFVEENEPLFVYCYGNLELLNKKINKVSIIGTRKATNKAKIRTAQYVKNYISKGWITVSGLAKGIDTVVHKETLINNGRTIAVLPTSFEQIYPAENKGLFEEIINNDSLAISITGPFENTYKSNFLERNSIVAKICNEIFVIEASIKSGTLNTVRQGFEFNKKIYYDSSLLDDEVINYIKKYQAIDLNVGGGS
ncbi:DNA-processing protein DprA [Bacillus cereus]|nr:DNA-processing protein DprA [Bacillus cereus]HDR7980547.1 DNA-processing protein DprA [Bacillus cereus]HDR8229841.1 DNA-processing protein DprA [Bacillus cereus]HDR8417548.1 DNA-processing protein DprA [Bacillus cereus]